MLVRACAGGSGCKASQINAGIRRWACAGVLDGQRVGFSPEGGEGGRCPGVAFPGCSDHVLAAAGKRQEADVFSSRSASMLSAAPMATICALGARWPPFLLN